MNIFAQLEKAVTNTRRKMDSLPTGTAEHEEECSKLVALNAIAEYIRSGKWCRKKSGHERVMFALRCKSYAEAAEQLNTSEESLRASVYQASERIRAIIGFDIIKEILERDTIEAVDKFRLRTTDAAHKMFPAEALAAFPKETKISKMDGERFISAMEALRSVTVRGIEDTLENIDDDILSVVRYILFANDVKYIRHAAALYEFFMTNTNVERLRKKLNIKPKGDNAYEAISKTGQ